MNPNKRTKKHTHFDPWDNRMDHSDLGTSQTQIAFPFRRGFTGHEHYDRLVKGKGERAATYWVVSELPRFASEAKQSNVNCPWPFQVQVGLLRSQ